MRIPQLEQLEPRLFLNADLVVTAVTPLPGSVLNEAPAQIQVDFNEPLDSSSLNENTFRLRASGGDGSFQDGNERVVIPTSIFLDGGTQAIMDLTGVILADDAYEVTLTGEAEWISDRDAELLSMEISGALLPPPELYEQIRVDLGAIRDAYPTMTSIRHRPKWNPGELLIGLTEEAMGQFRNGEYHGLDALNNEYGPVTMTAFQIIDALHLTFVQGYNPEYLAPLYGAAEGVRYAHPNGLIGDGDDITISGSPLLPPARYTFERGWGDCPAGCISRHYWVFDVFGGSVSLVSESGDPLPGPLAPSIITDLEGDPLNGGRDEVFAFSLLDTTAPLVAVDALVTNHAAPRLTGTVNDPNAIVEVLIQGNAYPAANNGDGSWTLADNTISPALAVGTYDVIVNATDAAGNTGTDGTSNELVVAASAKPVYRFWSPVQSRHFYTINVAERDKLINNYPQGWTYEGVGYYAFADDAEPGVAPVYRFWSAGLNAHFYTVSRPERDKLMMIYPHVWAYEGVAFYAYAAGSQFLGTRAVYRFWSRTLNCHFCTMSQTERDKLITLYSHVWTYETVAWYAYE